MSGRRGLHFDRAALNALALMFLYGLCAPGCSMLGAGHRSRLQLLPRSAGGDSFDPWTVLGIPTNSGREEARKAYKKLIAKYHPDVDMSTEGQAKFQQVVRAHAVITGEDKELGVDTLLSNAVENLRNDVEFKKAQIERLRAQAKAEEADLGQMQERLVTAQKEKDKVTQELGVFGGAALGLLVAGPKGAVIGGVLGLALKDRQDSLGQVVKGAGAVVRGLLSAVGKAGSKE